MGGRREEEGGREGGRSMEGKMGKGGRRDGEMEIEISGALNVYACTNAHTHTHTGEGVGTPSGTCIQDCP